ncbi:ABC transporter permease [Actinocorallia longicatena]|uniref:ABC transporter permease n=1 Tax=Actinocorallia longicatena TaxID=111803 RepID=A0ABP6QEF2_9ACTN
MADVTLAKNSTTLEKERSVAEATRAEVAGTPDPVAPALAAVSGPPLALVAGLTVWRGVRSLLAIAIFLAVWETLPRTGVVDRVFLPPFSEVLTALKDLAVSGQLWENTQASLVRSLAGFGISLALAIPLGLVLGWYKPVAEFLNPLLEVFRNTAALALLPVFVLILGLGETSKISIVVYACAWPILLNTIAGVKGVDPLLIKSARSLGLPAHRLFQKVILPAAVPTIFTGIRLAGAYSILILVAAEMVGAKAGLGFLINDSQFNFRIPDMYAGIVAISVIGLAFNALLLRLERRFSTWRTTQ